MRFLILLCMASSAMAATLGEPHESEARKSVQTLLARKDPLADLKQIYKIFLKKQKINSAHPPLIQECEAFPKNCTPGNILLFRGQGTVSAPGTSALVRSIWEGTSYVSSMENFSDALTKLNQDLSPLKTILAAPNEESADMASRLVLSKTSAAAVWWNEEHVPFEFYRYRNGSPKKPFLNSRQLLFSFHTSATYLYFNDLVLKKEVSLDPIISFSSDLTQAMVFAVGNPAPTDKHHPGQLIVISVPKTQFTNLCSNTLIPGEVWDTQKCNEYLNPHDDENEYDVFGYIPANLIRGSFFTKWEDVSFEIQQR